MNLESKNTIRIVTRLDMSTLQEFKFCLTYLTAASGGNAY